MTAQEVLERLQTQLKSQPDKGECEARIVLKMPSLGPLRTTPVQNIGFGFDWDNGSLLIWPEQDLVLKEDKYAQIDPHKSK